jgi:hypothetical protein
VRIWQREAEDKCHRKKVLEAPLLCNTPQKIFLIAFLLNKYGTIVLGVLCDDGSLLCLNHLNCSSSGMSKTSSSAKGKKKDKLAKKV